jgi:arylsulfatase A-like enzyme
VASAPAGSPTIDPGASSSPSNGSTTGPPRNHDIDVAVTPPPGWVDDPNRPIIEQPRTPLRRSTTTRTNIVVIMLDDLAEMDLRVWNRLPTIRQVLIDRGLRFTRFYGNDPFCCPGRANFLTGQFTTHHGVWTNEASLLDPSTTIATELHGAGYHTIISGKYLNAMNRLRDKTPPGWSRATMHSNGYYRYNLYHDGVLEYHDNDPNDYSTDVFANDIVAKLRSAPPSKPVFALFTPFAVHAGIDAAARQRTLPVPARRHVGDQRCEGIPNWSPPNYLEQDVLDKPLFIRTKSITDDPMYANGWPMRPICETLLSVDEAFARIVSELGLQGRLSDTLFVLTVDNGMTFGSHRWMTKQAPYATQLPLFVAWTRGRGTQPGTSETWLSNVDLAPTLCAIGGCLMGPYRSGRRTADGMSFAEIIGGAAIGSPRDALYEEHRSTFAPRERGSPWRAVRTTDRSALGLWHYVEYDSGERELYDAQGGHCWEWQDGDPGDPCELTNLAGDPEYAEVQAELAAELAGLVDQPFARRD